MYINCGGEETTFKGKTYEKDNNVEGASQFFTDGIDKWAYSSTGAFIGNQGGSHLAKNTSALNSEDAEMYQTARLAPISLIILPSCSCLKFSENYFDLILEEVETEISIFCCMVYFMIRIVF